jgi:hypothetical protein
MMEDQMVLEQRVRALEDALAAAERRMDQMAMARQGSLRSSRLAAGGFLMATVSVLIGAARGGLPTAIQAPQPLTVRAPFKVVDGSGTEIAVVLDEGGQRGVKVRTSDGVPLAFMGVQDNGTGIIVNNRATESAVFIGDIESQSGVYQGVTVSNGPSGGVVGVYADGRGGHVEVDNLDHSLQSFVEGATGFQFRKAGVQTAQLGPGDKGNMALRIGGAGNKAQLVAALGESADRSGGGLLLKDAAGKDAIKAAIAPGQGGQVVVYGGGGGQAGIATKGTVGSIFAGPIDAPVAKLGESEASAGAGVLELGAPGGGSAVQAGFSQGGGIVETYTPGKPVGILKAGIKIPGFTAGSNQ